MNKISYFVLVFFVNFLFCMMVSANTYYNASNDFCISNNPNKVWSYGWMDNDFSTFIYYKNTELGLGNSPIWWQDGIGSSAHMWKNITSETHYGVAPNQLSLHPGPNHEPSTLRFTAPIDGEFKIEAEFFAGHTGSMKVGIRQGKEWIWKATNSGSFSFKKLLKQNDSIDFVVYGGWCCGNTPLELNIIHLNELSRVYNPQNNHYYQRIDLNKTWPVSKTYCESIGGHLATITSQDENNFIFNNLVKGASTVGCWLGGNDADVEGEWRWVTNENWDYSNWDSGEPNDGLGRGQDHLHMYTSPGKSGRWDDAGPNYDNAMFNFICEWEESNNCQYYDSDNDGVIDQLDKCLNTPNGLLTDKYGCSPVSSNGSVYGYLFMKNKPLINEKAMLIQSGEIHQTTNLTEDGFYKFETVAEEKPFSIIIRKNRQN